MTTLTVIQQDGSTGTPGERDTRLLTAAQRLLQADPHFQALQTPTLDRAEVNAGIEETEPGYLYLRFQVPGVVPQELWAHWGVHDRVAWKSGQITVKQAETGSTTGCA